MQPAAATRMSVAGNKATSFRDTLCALTRPVATPKTPKKRREVHYGKENRWRTGNIRSMLGQALMERRITRGSL